jgi:hypothetical protein
VVSAEQQWFVHRADRHFRRHRYGDRLVVIRALALLLALLMGGTEAHAQQWWSTSSGGAGGGCVANCTFTGTLTAPTVNATGANGFEIGGIVAIAPGGGGGPAYTLGSPNNVGNVYDLALGTTTRQNTIYTQLSSSIATSAVWENAYSSVTLSGPGIANAEINAGHQSIIINAGANSQQSESDEIRLDNSGTIGTYDGILSTLNNLPGGTASFINGAIFNLSNTNATAGSIGSYIAMQCTPLVGGGSEPTSKFCLRNIDANSGISTLGNVNIGSVAQPSASIMLAIFGPDVLSTTFPLSIKAFGGLTLFSVADSGALTMEGPVTIGTSGSVVGTLSFVNATSGSIKFAPPTGALTPVILTLPDVTSTLAVLAGPQTFTLAQTFSGTLNVSGTLQSGGVAGVSCAAGTVVVATTVVTGGVVTHC